MIPRAHDVVVVGGGPAGSATAARLAKTGIDVALLDRDQFPRTKCCAEYGSPETVRELDRLGVLAAVERFGTTNLAGMEITAAAGNRLTGIFSEAGGLPFRPTGLALPRTILDNELIAHAQRCGATVYQGRRAQTITTNDDGRMTVGADYHGRCEKFNCRIVVGADGLRSKVATELKLRIRGRVSRMAFVAHFQAVSGMSRSAEMHVGRNGYVGLNPIDDSTTNVALVVPTWRAREACGDTARFLGAALGQFPSLRSRIDLSALKQRVMVTGPFDVRCRSSISDGAVLVGDAADFFDPFTGEGILAALVGGRLASETIMEALNQSGAIKRRHLADYRHRRRKEFLGKWLLERAIGHAMEWPRFFDRAVAGLERRGMGSTMIGVTGGFVPHSKILNPLTLATLMG